MDNFDFYPLISLSSKNSHPLNSNTFMFFFNYYNINEINNLLKEREIDYSIIVTKLLLRTISYIDSSVPCVNFLFSISITISLFIFT